MPRYSLIVLLTISGLLWTGPEAAARSRKANPLAPLKSLSATLQRAMGNGVKGTWSTYGGKLRATVRSKVRKKMIRAGAISVRLVGFEFELYFYKGATATYHLRTMVYPDPRGPAFMSLRGGALTGRKTYATSHPPSAYKGPARHFAKAARALVRAVAQGRCLQLPIASASVPKRLGVPSGMAKKFLWDIRRARRALPKVCKELAHVARHRFTVRIDDIAFFVRDGSRRHIGLLRADLRLRGGVLHLEGRRFRPFRP